MLKQATTTQSNKFYFIQKISSQWNNTYRFCLRKNSWVDYVENHKLKFKPRWEICRYGGPKWGAT